MEQIVTKKSYRIAKVLQFAALCLLVLSIILFAVEITDIVRDGDSWFRIISPIVNILTFGCLTWSSHHTVEVYRRQNPKPCDCKDSDSDDEPAAEV